MKNLKSILISGLKYSLYFLLSLLLAFTIRLFFCNFYVIPSDSMEPEILPGDFILANKWTYGARIFTSLKFDRTSDPPMTRIPKFRHIKRNDAVVFNSPYRYEWDTIRMNLEEIFVKRCIGLPGDSISIINGYYHIAGIPDTLGYIPEQKRMMRYQATLDTTILHTFPFDSDFSWNAINFGPLYIPVAGATIELIPSNLKLYHKQIVYETGAVVRQEDSLVYINDTLRHDYTFRSNWYFMAGDKVMNSQDSRYMGVIPEAYIIGKASMVMSSKDKYTAKRRWNRFMKRIN